MLKGASPRSGNYHREERAALGVHTPLQVALHWALVEHGGVQGYGLGQNRLVVSQILGRAREAWGRGLTFDLQEKGEESFVPHVVEVRAGSNSGELL